MESLSTYLFFNALFLLLMNSAAVDIIPTNQGIRDGETIISAGEMFEVGFFSPGKSPNRYLGIWYYNISPKTVVWVANRETPLTTTSGVFKVSKEGSLLLLSGGDTVIWSSNSSVAVGNVNSVAQILDTGNLIVRNDGRIDQESLTWQSFDYPGDTLLPGVKFGKDLVTGLDWHLTSSKSTDDPSPGEYVNYIDTNGFPQLTQRRGSVIQWRLGPWNGLRFSGIPSESPNPIFTYEFVFNEKEIYYKYDLINSSVFSRVYLNPEGTIGRLNWIDRTQSWYTYLTSTTDSCSPYGFCGPNGICNMKASPLCSCIEGFEPKRPKEWNIADWSSGCQRKKPLECENRDSFWKISGVKFPDTRRSWYNVSMTLGECEIACKKNCSCTAYANLDIRNGGSGCLLWYDELLDIRNSDEIQDLYIRLAASELTASMSGLKKKNLVLTVVLPILSVALVLLGMSIAVYACCKKNNLPHMKRLGPRVHAHNKGYQRLLNPELPLFSFSEIAKATDNFSIHNKLGQGGFGSVYKGVLDEGQEIAVKRLSESSEQGLDEFQNEVVWVAKLQHRNLVKLLGYSIQGDERILIYEYMANNSLDSVLFDETRSPMLDWPQRFCIIHGIARGLLYLHQDSRFRIVHRDLKAGNILLDHDMNAKISDFGLARQFGGNDTTAKTRKVVGTYGYISPEYAVHGHFSIKSDVFSFGVLVLEIVSGKKNREFSHDDHRDNLLGHAWRLYKEGKCLELMSADLHDSCIVSEVIRSVHVALLCVQNHAQDRPNMSSVVLMFGSEGALPPAKQPAFFTEESSNVFRPFTSSVNEATITQVEAR